MRVRVWVGESGPWASRGPKQRVYGQPHVDGWGRHTARALAFGMCALARTCRHTRLTSPCNGAWYGSTPSCWLPASWLPSSLALLRRCRFGTCVGAGPSRHRHRHRHAAGREGACKKVRHTGIAWHTAPAATRSAPPPPACPAPPRPSQFAHTPPPVRTHPPTQTRMLRGCSRPWLLAVVCRGQGTAAHRRGVLQVRRAEPLVVRPCSKGVAEEAAAAACGGAPAAQQGVPIHTCMGQKGHTRHENSVPHPRP